MAAKKKAPKKKPRLLRGLPGSTEAGARRVLKKHIQKKPAKPKLTKDTGGKTTAKSAFKKTKTPAQKKAALAKVRAAQAARVAAARKKKK